MVRLVLGAQIHNKSQAESKVGFCTKFQLFCETNSMDLAAAAEEENFHS